VFDEAFAAFGLDRSAREYQLVGFNQALQSHQVWCIWWMLKQDKVRGGCVSEPPGMGKVCSSSTIQACLSDMVIITETFIMQGHSVVLYQFIKRFEEIYKHRDQKDSRRHCIK
jgi:hypothetical protein